MNKPSKCKNCQWYGKPYWSIINPCDNCPNEEINTIITVNNNGLTISKDNISTSTGKIVLNNVEIIDTDTFYKAVETFNELKKEIKDKDKKIARLNEIINKIKNIVFDKNLWEDEYEGCFKTIDDDFCERYYLLKELKKILKEEGKE